MDDTKIWANVMWSHNIYIMLQNKYKNITDPDKKVSGRKLFNVNLRLLPTTACN
jgi:hypothetical protein